MNDEDRDFEIKLAKVGMRYGAFMAVTAALFALGGEELIRLNLLSGSILLVSGIITAYVCTKSTRKETEDLKNKNPTQTEKTRETKISCINHRPSFWLSKTHDGVEHGVDHRFLLYNE